MTECSSCKTENRIEARFCAGCGGALQAQPGQKRASAVATLVTQPLNADLASNTETPAATQPLPPAPFSLLPEEGAIIPGPDGQEYRVERIENAGERMNVYHVRDLQGARPCPNSQCGRMDNGPQENFCTYCGSDLSGAPVVKADYLIRESSDEQLFEIEAKLLSLGIQHPSWQLPRAYFYQVVGGRRRFYLVTPMISTNPFSLQIPLEKERALQWGHWLAGGLAALHQNGIAFGPMKMERVMTANEQMYWADFTQCLATDNAQQFVKETKTLAGWLCYWMTGQKQYAALRDSLPSSLQALFDRALVSDHPFTNAGELEQALHELIGSARRPQSVDLHTGRRSDVGLERQLNEDSLLLLDMAWNNKSVNQPIGFFVVADGMGGHAAGEVASGLTVQTMAQLFVQGLLSPTVGLGGEIPEYEAWVKEAVSSANTTVHQRVKETGHDMGTTVVAALVVADQAYIAHVGDSRAYLINKQTIEQLTVDHTLVERLVATKQITREEARHHPQRSVIYRTIGDKQKVEIDTTAVALSPGDYLLLCSDGLNGMVSDEAIRQHVINAPSPQSACDKLVEAANAAGGEDNITVILVQMEETQVSVADSH